MSSGHSKTLENDNTNDKLEAPKKTSRRKTTNY